ncbi:MAG: holo-ACP synthase [Chthoniobacteraceae bacterium]
MRITGIGVDIVEIARFASSIERSGQSFLDRVFLAAEQSYCSPQREPARCFAARFAAKEAVAKALGTGIGAQLGWRDIEILRKETGEPVIALHGIGAETAQGLGVAQFFLSISHSEHYAVANVLAVGRMEGHAPSCP